MKRIVQVSTFIIAMALAAGCGGKHETVTPRHQTLSDAGNAMQKAIATYNKGCYRAALKEFYRAHELYTLSDDINGIAMCMNNMGNIYRHVEEYADAVSFFDKAYDLYMKIGNTKGAVQALSNKAAVMIADDRLAEAETLLDKAVVTLPEGAAPPIPVLNNRGILCMKQGQTDTAEALLKKALTRTGPEDLGHLATVSGSLGNLMARTGRYEAALHHFTTAYEADRKRGSTKNMAEDLSDMATACVELDQWERAAGYLERSIKIYALTGDVVRAHKAYERLVSLAREHDYDIAITSHFVKKWLKGETIRTYCR
ncbi:MAG: tetratricopeptide repeat protein [Thermodesulfobacteriota bacterium]|nr:tetratricopeptide repeat protein [Thermodesulfobacteriota bacterium]